MSHASGGGGGSSGPLATGAFAPLFTQLTQAIRQAGARREELRLIMSYLELADAYAYGWEEAQRRGIGTQAELDAQAEHARYHLAQASAIVSVSVLLTDDEKAAITAAVDQMATQLGGQP